MHITEAVYNFFAEYGAVNEEYCSDVQGNVVELIPQATNAMATGHLVYHVAYYIAQKKDIEITQALAGTAGEFCNHQEMAYNWGVVGDVLQRIGFNLMPEQRQMISDGDKDMLNDLLEEMTAHFTGRGPASPEPWADKVRAPASNRSPRKAKSCSNMTKAQTPTPKRERTAPEQLDTSLYLESSGNVSPRKIGPDESPGYMTPRGAKPKLLPEELPDVRLPASPRGVARQSFETAESHKDLSILRRKERIWQLLRDAEDEAKLREEVTDGMDVDKLKRRERKVPTKIPTLRSHHKRGVVVFLIHIILDIVDRVLSGAAHEDIRKADARHKEQQRLARERKKHLKLLDGTALVRCEKDQDHKTALFFKDIILDMIKDSVQPNVVAKLEEKEAQRKKEHAAMVRLMKRQAEEEAEAKAEREREKEDNLLKQLKAMEEAEKHQQKLERWKHEIEEQKAKLKEQADKRKKAQARERKQQRLLQREKDEAERLRREQIKAQVEDMVRRRKEKEEAEKERKREEERAAARQRKERGKDINQRFAKQEEGRLLQLGRKSVVAPLTLSNASMGTGEEGAFEGDTAGWQFLTAAECHLGQLFAELRKNPKSGVPWMDARRPNMYLKTWTIEDIDGNSIPVGLAETSEALDECVAFLNKQRSLKPPKDVSIGLTLAARQHACDLAHHGIADSTAHTGTDGSTITNRVLRYGQPKTKPGFYEVIYSVVRPAETVKIEPSDVLCAMLLDDGQPRRPNRHAFFDIDNNYNFGVGHAVATAKAWAVEVYVIVTANEFVDKPVLSLSQMHYNGLLSVAEPFLQGNRVVLKELASKKTLLSTPNYIIGKRTEGKPSTSKLFGEKLGRHKIMAKKEKEEKERAEREAAERQEVGAE